MDPGDNIFMEEENELAKYTKLRYAMPLKMFVPAKGPETATSSSNKLKITNVTGSKTKESYLHIVGNEALKSNSEEIAKNLNILPQFKHKTIKCNPILNLDINNVMKAVEANDVCKVLEFIETDKRLVLNGKDQYGWSSLMNACCAGAKDVVKLLLKYEPNLTVTDKRGNTCFTLARSKGHNKIVDLLEIHKKVSNNVFDNIYSRIDTSKNSDSLYCEICKEVISNSIKSHFTSTVHLFNASKKSAVPTSYGIPEHNVGFQMLLKTGWDKEKGLGPEGSGHKFPPKTALKQDRAGLGAKKYVSRVTHDASSSLKDRSERQTTLNRRERIRNEMKIKRKERELRRMLD